MNIIKKIILLIVALSFFIVLANKVEAASGNCTITSTYVYYNGVAYKKICMLPGAAANAKTATCGAYDDATAKMLGELSALLPDFNEYRWALLLLDAKNGLGLLKENVNTIYIQMLLDSFSKYASSQEMEDAYREKNAWPADLSEFLKLGIPESDAKRIISLQKKVKVDRLHVIFDAVKSQMKTTSAKISKYDANTLEISKSNSDVKIDQLASTSVKLTKTSSGASGATFTLVGDGTITSATAKVTKGNCTATVTSVGGDTITVAYTYPHVISPTSTEPLPDVCILEDDEKNCSCNISIEANVQIKSVGGKNIIDSGSKYDNAPNYIYVQTGGGNQPFVGEKVKQKSPDIKVTNKKLTAADSIEYQCGKLTCEGSVSQHIDSSPSNCCKEEELYYKENELSELFCPHTQLGVKYYKAKTGSGFAYDSYANGKLTNEEEYCSVYCTEKVQIDQPGPIKADIGMNFYLKGKKYTSLDGGQWPASGETTSAFVDSYKRCREIINYHKWVTKYHQQVKNEVEGYNTFQYAVTAESFYGGREEKNIELSAIATYKCPKNDGTTETVPVPKIAGNTTEFNYTKVLKKKEATEYYVAIIKPDGHEHAPNKSYTNMEVQLDNKGHYDGGTDKCATSEDAARYTGITVSVCESSQDKRTTTPGLMKIGHNPITYDEAIKDAYGAAKINADSEAAAAAAECGGTFYPAPKLCFENFDNINENIKNLKLEGQSKFTTAATEIVSLEEKINKCQNYFQNSDPAQAYKVDTDMKFTYMQTYLNENMKCVNDGQEVKYNAHPDNNGENCSPTTMKIEANTSIGTDGKTYSTKEYSADESTTETMINMVNALNGRQTSLNLRPAKRIDKMFSIDAFYTQKCFKEEEPSELISEYPSGHPLIPDGSLSESYSTNFIKNSRLYYVYTSTLAGVYETFWEITKIGEKRQFDSPARSKTTCSGLSSDGNDRTSALNSNPATCGKGLAANKVNLSDPLFTCEFEVPEVLIQTGKCNDIAPYKGCTIDHEGYNYFNFKIADPKNLFPSCGLSKTPTDSEIDACFAGNKYAFNWLKMDQGKKALKEIQKSADEDKTFSPAKLTHSIILTPTSIESIRKYNKEVGTYDDFNLSCSCPSDPECKPVSGEVTNTCETLERCSKCKSKFLESFYKSGILPGASNLKVSKASGDLDTIRKKIWN